MQSEQHGWGSHVVPPAEDLFGSTTMALMADVLALLVAVANVVAARIEDGETGQRDGQRRR